LLSIARQGLFYILLLFLLSSRFLFKGLLWAQPISDAITLSLALVLLVSILKKYQKDKKETSSEPISLQRDGISCEVTERLSLYEH